MSTLRLVNPQPMWKLPNEGRVFLTDHDGNVWDEPVSSLRRFVWRAVTAWSYTATFEPETLNKETNDE